MRNKLFVIGSPIEQSKSPEVMKDFINKDGLELTYEKKEINKDGLESFANEAKTGEVLGFNITTPLKEEILKYADEVSEAVKILEAANTASLANGKISLHNTDYIGFMKDITSQIPKYERYSYAVLGTGGAARSIIYALLKLNIFQITVYTRDEVEAHYKLKNFEDDIEIYPYGYGMDQDIIINATGLGMAGKLDESPLSKEDFEMSRAGFAYDLTYNPEETKFLALAKEAGLITMNGWGMFMGQAEEAFKIWTGADRNEL